MNSTAMLKLAASAAIMGSTMVGCSPMGQAMRPANASDAKLAKAAAQSAAAAQKAIARHDFASAVVAAESAVAAMPRDASFRMLLGQAYLGAGRFASAETAFSDVLTLSPDHDRAALNLALVEIGLGKKEKALATLADYREKLAANDYGLALALAGDTHEAVRVLEISARDTGADAKTRQNLALAYALDGQWSPAHTMAQQDLAPADADARMLEWAAFARPDGGKQQVAMLLGVTPASDAGQPTRLALAPDAQPGVQSAFVTPAAAPTAQATPPLSFVSEAAPVAQAPQPAAEPAAVIATPVAIVDAPPPVFDTAPAKVVRTVASRPVAPAKLIRANPAPAKQMIVLGKTPASKNAAAAGKSLPKAPRAVEGGKFVVQLGAFENAAVSHDAWKRIAPRFGLNGFDPGNATAKVGNASFVRLTVGGFATREDANLICTKVRASGGSCFVRGLINDAPAQWVQRGVTKPAAKPVRVASR